MVKRALSLFGVSMLAAAPQPGDAAGCRAFAVPPGPLSGALIAFGRQAGLSIGGTGVTASGARSQGVSGCRSVDGALRRLLNGTGYDYRRVGGDTIQIVEAARRRPRPSAPPQRQPPEAPSGGDAPIIVTASKQDTPLTVYPGSVEVVRFGRDAAAAGGSGNALVGRLPILAQTNLGPGRNKLFIRGVADSSFTGPSQSTVAQYLGDVRLTYSAPDPNLNLYDTDRVEVLEGPQGTLYGAGSLGGVISIVPNAPVSTGFAGSAAAGLSTTKHGDWGSDFAAMLNLPLSDGRAALRLVGYRTVEGGYIDDAGRGLKNVNRTASYGGRATLRLTPGNGWTIDAGLVLHNGDADDSQYAERGEAPLTRRSAIAQPFDNDFLLGQLVVRKNWDWGELVSATGIAHQRLGSTFDATGFVAAPGPAALIEDSAINLFSHETRLSGDLGGGGHWIVGGSFVRNEARTKRLSGPVGAAVTSSDVRNTDIDTALFGEVRVDLWRHVFATGGARIAYSHRVGEVFDNVTVRPAEPKRNSLRVLPSAALSWEPVAKLIVFARYQRGFRAGGLAVDGAAADPTVREFQSDTIATKEIGVRFGEPGRDKLSAAVTLSQANWSDIQADLVNSSGLPYTDNIGDGQVKGVEASLSWSPTPRALVAATIFGNRSSLDRPDGGFADSSGDELPNIAEMGVRVSGRLTVPTGGWGKLTLEAWGRYSGQSRLGVGPVLDIPQGRYLDAGASARLEVHGVGLSLSLTNIADETGNRFSYGNPFTVTERRQITPLRPRTLRFGVDAVF